MTEAAAASVKDLALELWELREEQPTLHGVDPCKWSRRLARTVVVDCDAKQHWDPEDSACVLWIRAVVAARLHGMSPPRASDRLEASCAMLIGKMEEWEPEWLRERQSLARPVTVERCGKDRAAGD